MLPETDGYKVLRQKKPTMSSVSLKCKLDMGRANVGSAGLDVGDFQRVSFLLQTSLIIYIKLNRAAMEDVARSHHTSLWNLLVGLQGGKVASLVPVLCCPFQPALTREGYR